MDNGSVLDALLVQFGEDQITAINEPHKFLTFTVPVDKVNDVLRWLKDHKDFKYNFLTTLFGVHYPHLEGKEMAIVYQLHSWENNHRIRIKTFVPIAEPNVPTATNLWNTANWMERETYDFFGVNFIGHPDLRRILNMDEMDYFPLRKEYPLEDQMRQDKVDYMFGR